MHDCSVKYDNTYKLTTALQKVIQLQGLVYFFKRNRYSACQEIPSVDPDDWSQCLQIPAIEPST